MFYVKYAVDGKPGTRLAGPYLPEEAEYHRDDIAGYDFVIYAIIVPAEEVSTSNDVFNEIEKAFK
jgi:hypothetical protein